MSTTKWPFTIKSGELPNPTEWDTNVSTGDTIEIINSDKVSNTVYVYCSTDGGKTYSPDTTLLGFTEVTLGAGATSYFLVTTNATNTCLYMLSTNATGPAAHRMTRQTIKHGSGGIHVGS